MAARRVRQMLQIRGLMAAFTRTFCQQYDQLTRENTPLLSPAGQGKVSRGDWRRAAPNAPTRYAGRRGLEAGECGAMVALTGIRQAR